MFIHLRDRDVDRWTLRQVLERGILAFECRKCGHLAQLDVLDLVGRFGPEMPVGRVRAKTVCRLCGGRQVRSLVRLKVGRKELAWVPVPPRAGR
jgi:ribosomal protein L40E